MNINPSIFYRFKQSQSLICLIIYKTSAFACTLAACLQTGSCQIVATKTDKHMTD
jgi:hypothetical protein